jgi:mono/diheme cytochrome c family protein
MRMRTGLAIPALLAGAFGLVPAGAWSQETTRELYEIGCSSCHGRDGAGGDSGTTVAFETPVPDFSDCSFASREPDADWIAVAHAGGPVRGFDATMPAFGEAFTEEQLQRIMDYVRTFCGNDAWPRGELNLPRALVTEKAYPEDEAVTTVTVAAEGAGSVVNELVYEKRFGARNQIEIAVPFGAVEGPDGWSGGLGDIALGVKRAMWHSFESGSIFSLGGEVVLPTGRESVGLGKGTTVFEPFASFGQIVGGDGFLQLFGAVEIPASEESGAETEGIWRGVAGWTFATGELGFGRTYTPMVELLGARDLEDGASTAWDIVPQMQISLNTRQHVLLNAGVRLPIDDSARSSTVILYILWDWFDGGFFDGW